MNSYDRNEKVIRFIDSLDGNKHIGLIYDDPDFAKLIKFRFIKNGLQNGENCIYVTDEDSGKVVVDMITYGIPIRYFQTNKIIVYHQNDAGKTRQEIQKNTDTNMAIVRNALVPPFRIVGRLVPNIENADGMNVQIDLEKKTHGHYNDFGGIVMCSYEVSKIEKTKRKKWIEELYRNHHYTIKISAKDGSEVLTAS